MIYSLVVFFVYRGVDRSNRVNEVFEVGKKSSMPSLARTLELVIIWIGWHITITLGDDPDMKHAIFSLLVLSTTLFAGDPKVLFKYIPIKNSLVIGADLEQMLSVNSFKQLAKLNNIKNRQDFFTFTGISFSDLDSVVLSASVTPPGAEPNAAAVIRAKVPFYIEKIAHSFSKEANKELSETSFKGHAVYSVLKGGGENAIYFAQLDERSIIVGSSLGVREVLSTQLIKSVKNITNSYSMMNLLADNESMFFVGLDLNHDLREQLEQAKSMFGASATKTREGELNFKKLRSLLVGLHVGKMNSQFNLKLSCADKETAQILHKLIEANQAHLIKGTDKIIQNGNITSSTTGSETLFSLKLNQSQLDSLKKQFKPMFKQFNPEKASTEAKEEAADLSP